MIITVAGFAGSGKTTLGTILAEKLKYALITPSFKELALQENISLMMLQEKAEKDKSIDLRFDANVKEQAKKGDCVITTWLGPWMIKTALRIWLFAPLDVRAKRIAKRDGISITRAKKEIKKRELQNRKRYLKLYKIDIFDTSIFDISFNSEKFSPEEMADVILKIIKIRKTKN